MKEQLYTHKPNQLLMQPAELRSERIGDYIPRRTRDAEEAERRRSNTSGTLVLEMQQRGLEIARGGLEQAETLADALEWAQLMAIAGLGTAPYLFNGEVMNRQTKLPQLGFLRPDLQPSSEQLLNQSRHALDYAVLATQRAITAQNVGLPPSDRAEFQLESGKAVACAANLMAVAPLGDLIQKEQRVPTGGRAQLLARRACLETVQTAQTVGLEIGAYPSFAQVADPLSPFAVEIQRAGGDCSAALYEELAA